MTNDQFKQVMTAFREVNSQLREIKGDVATLKDDVSILKKDMAEQKVIIAQLQKHAEHASTTFDFIKEKLTTNVTFMR
ncbi:hypothetical protein M4D48_08935 [Alkalihalobacillus clausii]|jgi:phage shock protein A|uniref:hypothetical protein n=1 Tax=Shouchella clausii TaxID=79880 RepID=UPI000BA67AD2|nr:hypothetical protein [Shouchella clausii]MCM3548696.1 hypothetical protein [Shouchella clausii]PAF13495.1 hypothetical protein CHH59_13600 [Shouchella clausii]